MDLRFTTPELRKLDLLGTEVIVSTLASDERPPHGVTGLLDFRLAGRISRLIQSGFATGRVGEVVLVPGKPKLPFDKLLLFGIGKQTEFNDPVFRAVLDKMLRTLEGLRARTAVVELPGRHFDAISPERAADILLESAGGQKEHDVWTLIEPLEAQRAITQHMIQERRRVRHV
ncbi:MAG TPA: M17 family peptidase N-terminal domain-containing protein [Polyangiaceae bacterium]|nr:M17 family peptidase N-terminal domain-containing protein [Polyangiaceae bacterium]